MNTIRQRRSRLSPRATAIDTRPTSPAFAAPGLSPQPKPKRADAGPRVGSSSSPAATPLRRASCARTSLSTAPRLSLIIAGNHKPSLRSVDEAIRRRFHLIPFAVTIPPEERDGDLAEKLKAEWPGILAWLVEGCLEWQTEGLRPPKAVLEATEAYLSAEDSLAAWIEEKCERSASRIGRRHAALFASWSAWATAAGENPGSSKRFAQALEFQRVHRQTAKSSGRGFDGLRLIPEANPWDEGRRVTHVTRRQDIPLYARARARVVNPNSRHMRHQRKGAVPKTPLSFSSWLATARLSSVALTDIPVA